MPETTCSSVCSPLARSVELVLDCCARNPGSNPNGGRKMFLIHTEYHKHLTYQYELLQTSWHHTVRLNVYMSPLCSITFLDYFLFYLQVAMDPVHGALSCKGCVNCIPGVTFSKFINYGPCRQCKNCTASGLRYTQPCTVEENAKCGGPLPPPPTKQQM